MLFDPTCGFDEVDCVVVVFLDSGGYGEDVGIEDDVVGREVDFFREDVVGSLANGNSAFVAVGLALLVEGHNDNGGAIGPHLRGVFAEFVGSFFEGYGIYYGLALNAFESGFDDAPFGGVYHDGNAGDVGFGCDEVEVALHGGLAVEHAFVEVHVDDLGAVIDLLPGDFYRFFVALFADEAGEGA